MELDAGPEAGIEYFLHGLQYHTQEANPQGVYVLLGYQDQDGPQQLERDIPGAPHVVQYFHNLYPPSKFWMRGSLSLVDRPHRATS